MIEASQWDKHQAVVSLVMWGRPSCLPTLVTLVTFSKFYHTAMRMTNWTVQMKTTFHCKEAQILRESHFFLPSCVMAEGLWCRWIAHLAMPQLRDINISVSLGESGQGTWADGWCYRTPLNICEGNGCGQQRSQVPGVSPALSTPVSLNSESYQHYSVAFCSHCWIPWTTTECLFLL